MQTISLVTSDPRAVTPRLLDFLGSHLGVDNLAFAEEPIAHPDSWEAYIFQFTLAPNPKVPDRFLRPLILRIYSNNQEWDRLFQEHRVQEHLAQLGYPVPRSLLVDRDSRWFGGPFMVREAVEGRTLLSVMLKYFPAILRAPARAAAMHAWLHQLPTRDFPVSSEPFLDRSLKRLRHIIRQQGLDGLRPGLAWLEAHQPETPERPSILHLDFHPGNLIFQRRPNGGLLDLILRDGHCAGVLDWCDADVGDRHADLAVSIMIGDSVPVENLSMWQWPAMIIGRVLFRELYLWAYRQYLPIDPDRLRYYLAWASLQRLCRWQAWSLEGRLGATSKPCVKRMLTPALFRFMERYFQRHTGVAIQLSGGEWKSRTPAMHYAPAPI